METEQILSKMISSADNASGLQAMLTKMLLDFKTISVIISEISKPSPKINNLKMREQVKEAEEKIKTLRRNVDVLVVKLRLICFSIKDGDFSLSMKKEIYEAFSCLQSLLYAKNINHGQLIEIWGNLNLCLDLCARENHSIESQKSGGIYAN